MTFDQSLKELRERGYHRHPRPDEYFSLLCAYYENKLSPELTAIAKGMINGWHWEWLSVAAQRKKDYLYCYLDPENIVWGGKKERYVVDEEKIRCTQEFPFYVGSKREWISARDLDSEGAIWPTGLVGDRYYVDHYYPVRASRGVRVKEKNPRSNANV